MKEAAMIWRDSEVPPKLTEICKQLRLLTTQLELDGLEPSDKVCAAVVALASAVRAARTRDPNINPIVQVIADALRTTPEALRSRARFQHASFVRMQAMYLVRQLTPLSYPQLGRFFGGKHHSTIINGCQQIARRMERDQIFAHSMRKLTERVKAATR